MSLGSVGEGTRCHQQPDVNYIQVLENVDFPWMVTLTGSPFKGNHLKAETGKIVHFWLLVDRSRGLSALWPSVVQGRKHHNGDMGSDRMWQRFITSLRGDSLFLLGLRGRLVLLVACRRGISAAGMRGANLDKGGEPSHRWRVVLRFGIC